MKLFAAIALSGIVILLGIQIFMFLGKEREIKRNLSDLEARINAAKIDQGKFEAELNYYQNPDNLEKELRARFNYRAPGEKLLILVPRNASPASTSTSGQ